MSAFGAAASRAFSEDLAGIEGVRSLTDVLQQLGAISGAAQQLQGPSLWLSHPSHVALVSRDSLGLAAQEAGLRDAHLGPALSTDQVSKRLEYTPRLALPQVLLCLASALAAGAAYHFGAGSSVSPPAWHALHICLSAALGFFIVAYLLRERLYLANTVPAPSLRRAGSQFLDVDGLSVHFACTAPCRQDSRGHRRPPKRAMHLCHGFGANLFSFEPCRTKLADVLEATVTAHDMPAFGLTDRPVDLDSYRLDRNGALARKVMDKVGPKTQRRVLLGHSMGGVCAALEAIEHPEEYEALIMEVCLYLLLLSLLSSLLAPALVAFDKAEKRPVKGDPMHALGRARSEQLQRARSEMLSLTGMSLDLALGDASQATRTAAKLELPGRGLNVKAAADACVAMCWLAAATVLGGVVMLLQPLLLVVMRCVVRTHRFWETVLRAAWYAGEQLPAEMIDNYKLPQLVRGWEAGMLRFLACRISGGKSAWAALVEVFGCFRTDEVRSTSTVRRLAQLTATHRLRVLIVHGDHDRVVPLANSKRLLRQLPNSQLDVIERCGHCPHEEHPELFASLIQKFLDKVPANSSPPTPRRVSWDTPAPEVSPAEPRLRRSIEE